MPVQSSLLMSSDFASDDYSPSESRQIFNNLEILNGQAPVLFLFKTRTSEPIAVPSEYSQSR
jgi:hypothetical protein